MMYVSAPYSCHHAHSLDELRPKPDLTKTAMCPDLVKYGECTKGDRCKYAHHKAELKSTQAFVKTKMCNNPEKCAYGAACRYAHSVQTVCLLARFDETR